jgi:DNA polymerase family A
MLHADFETRSRVELRSAGVYRYAEDASTDVWCMAFAFDEEDVQLWVPGQEVPTRIAEHVASGRPITAHNAQFERIIWKYILSPRYSFPEPALAQWHCTAAEAAAMSLPRSLDQCAKVLNVEHTKDDKGYRLMLQMSKPRKPTKKDPREWWDDEERRLRLYEYCRQDVRVERAIGKRIRKLSSTEREVYLLDQRINDRGVMLDRPLIVAARALADRAGQEANESIAELTEGAVGAVTRVGDLTSWLTQRGVALENVQKSTLRDLLAGNELPELERAVIELRTESAKSSTAKLTAMLNCICADDRARGLLLYHGAGTGRWSGRLIQPQNFPRAADPVSGLAPVKNVERFIPDVLAGDYDSIAFEHPVLNVLAVMLRSMLRAAPGQRFMAGDYAQIEARIVAWIAEQDDLVTSFANGGKIYEEMAAFIQSKKLGRHVAPDEIGKDSPERTGGKITVLGAGFGMGGPKLAAQARMNYGFDMSDEDGQLAIDAYREKNARIKSVWHEIERAALRAVKKPGSVQTCGRRDAIKYTVRNQFLWCVLPSGRPLTYALPKIEQRRMWWDCKECKGTGLQEGGVLPCEHCEKGKVLGEPRDSVTCAGVDSMTRQWKRYALYGGLLTENVVQAMARDVMAAAMLRLEAAGYPAVMTVHDEVMCEVPIDSTGTLQEFLKLMQVRPRWAEDLPIAVDGWCGGRYRK